MRMTSFAVGCAALVFVLAGVWSGCGTDDGAGGGAGSGAGGTGGGGTGGAAGADASTAGTGPGGAGGGAGGSHAGSSGVAGNGGGGGGCTQASDCDDKIACTVDSCSAGICYHWPGPNLGATACSAGKICSVQQGCIQGSACATTDQCVQQVASDACKVNATCDLVTSTCTWDVLDKDSDGHPPPVCGGDDCDDTNGKLAPGLPEICDGADNNCNGEVDEGASCAPDDPCPPQLDLNCSDSCGSKGAQCDAAICSLLGPAPVGDCFHYPLVARTPSRPGFAADCAWCGDTAASLALRIQDPCSEDAGTFKFRVSVAPPWYLGARRIDPGAPDQYALCLSTLKCLIASPGDTVWASTADPGAPARNVTIELVDENANCNGMR